MYLYFTAVSQKPLLLAKNIKVHTRQLFIYTRHLIILNVLTSESKTTEGTPQNK